ncbi:MAG: glycosyltransferase family 2 protein [Aeromicrobium erythreum]
MSGLPVSVVVPTHRRPELLREAVQSVVTQDHDGEIEVLVVFDACPPELPDVDLPPGRTLRALENERTRGLAGARNTGVLAARHDLVAFLDDDDTWLPGKLEAQLELLGSDPEARLVGTAMQVDDGRTTHVRLVPHDPVTHADLVRDRIAGLHSSSFVFRRAALVDEIGLIDEDLPGAYGEDYDVLLTTAALGPVRVVNEPLVRVRWQGQSLFFGRWGQYAEALGYLLAKHRDIADDPDGASRVRSQIAFALAASGDRRAGRRAALAVLRSRPGNLRAWLALAIGCRLATAGAVATVAQRFGRGI